MSIVVTYCERVHSGFFGEPLNSLSNFAYLLCAWLLYRRWYSHARTDPIVLLPALLLALLGLGSAAYHSSPANLTLLLDVLPIFSMMLAFCWLIQTRLLGHSPVSTGITMALLLGSTVYLSLWPEFANGSLMYLPAVVFSGIALVLLRGQRQQRPLLLATIAFCSALAFRTIDNQLCALLPFGTHFLWHVLTALASYLAAGAISQHSLDMLR